MPEPEQVEVDWMPHTTCPLNSGIELAIDIHVKYMHCFLNFQAGSSSKLDRLLTFGGVPKRLGLFCATPRHSPDDAIAGLRSIDTSHKAPEALSNLVSHYTSLHLKRDHEAAQTVTLTSLSQLNRSGSRPLIDTVKRIQRPKSL